MHRNYTRPPSIRRKSERTRVGLRADTASLAEIVERILDKGIVIDGWARVSLAGVVDLITIESRVIIASIETYLKYSESFHHSPPMSWSVSSAVSALPRGRGSPGRDK